MSLNSVPISLKLNVKLATPVPAPLEANSWEGKTLINARGMEALSMLIHIEFDDIRAAHLALL